MVKQRNNIVKRGGTYSIRIMVPADVRKHFDGKREIVKALRTSSIVEATALGEKAVADYRYEFHHLREHGSPSTVVFANSPSDVGPTAPSLEVSDDFKPNKYSKFVADSAKSVGNLKVPTIMEAFEMYAADNPNGVTEDTLRQSRYIIKLFEEFVGQNPPVTMITKDNVRAWKHALAEWPVRATEIKELKGYTFPEALMICKELWGAGVRPTITKKTVNKYLSALGALCTWLEAETSYFQSNPVDNLYHKLDRMERKVYPFSGAQIADFFNTPVYRGCESSEIDFRPGTVRVQGFRYWLPLIAAHTGARLGEIAQMLTVDVKKLHERWVFHVTRDGSPEKRTKTAGSQRIIPMHPVLIDLGFLDYHAGLVEKKEPRLFPDVERDKRGQISGQPSRWFGRYMARVDMREGNRFNFHSFRHTVTDALRMAGYTNDQIGPLLGHTSGSMTARYGIEPPVTVEQRAKMIESINYGIDLSHLVTWKGVSAIKEAA